MKLAELRAELAGRLAGGDATRVETLLLDDVPVAGGVAGDTGWALTMEQAGVFGHRITCTVADPKEDFLAEFGCLEEALVALERGIASGSVVPGQARTDLAQLEAKLDRLQCKGIDSAVGGGDEARRERRELTRRADLLHARISGIFSGLEACKAARGRISDFL